MCRGIGKLFTMYNDPITFELAVGLMSRQNKLVLWWIMDVYRRSADYFSPVPDGAVVGKAYLPYAEEREKGSQKECDEEQVVM
jgi:hypothetical protein